MSRNDNDRSAIVQHKEQLFGAEGLSGLDAQASTGRANRREQSDDRHDRGGDR
jgi:hypothetical protein